MPTAGFELRTFMNGTMLLSFQLGSAREAIRSAALERARHMANGWLPVDDSDEE